MMKSRPPPGRGRAGAGAVAKALSHLRITVRNLRRHCSHANRKRPLFSLVRCLHKFVGVTCETKMYRQRLGQKAEPLESEEPPRRGLFGLKVLLRGCR